MVCTFRACLSSSFFSQLLLNSQVWKKPLRRNFKHCITCVKCLCKTLANELSELRLALNQMKMNTCRHQHRSKKLHSWKIILISSQKSTNRYQAFLWFLTCVLVRVGFRTCDFSGSATNIQGKLH